MRGFTEPVKKKTWEVVDVELAHIFYCETESGRDDFKAAIELLGHRALVKEIHS